jgi:hypothetical protein
MQANIESAPHLEDVEPFLSKLERLAEEQRSHGHSRHGERVSSTLHAVMMDEVANVIAKYLPLENGISKMEWVAQIRAALES